MTGPRRVQLPPPRARPHARYRRRILGTVLETFDTAVRVEWPGDRVAWHRRGDLQDATDTEVDA